MTKEEECDIIFIDEKKRRDFMNKETLGQVFTPDKIVTEMIGLIRNCGSTLEPSAGNGQIFKHLKNATGIEIDKAHATDEMLNIDFFDFSIENKFNTIVGNPPYVKYNKILPETKKKLSEVLDGRANLYMHFMNKCLDHLSSGGEIIFIVPRDFIKSTSAIPLNNRLCNEGSFTYWRETGDEVVFDGATPNTVVFRWEKDNLANPLNVKNINGQLIFGGIGSTRLGDIFNVKVGGASGNNGFFINENGNIDLVVSTTFETKETKRAYYYLSADELPSEFFKNKELLLGRKIKTFNENNWFEWGRKIQLFDGDRIYVNAKTRQDKPFFVSSEKYFDGSVIALAPKEDIDLVEWCDRLNNTDWSSLGFKVGGRLIFGQRALENILI